MNALYNNVVRYSTPILGPTREVKIVIFNTISNAADVADVKIGGKKTILVIGAIYYQDIFKAHRFSRFCWFADDLLSATMNACNDHNDAN